MRIRSKLLVLIAIPLLGLGIVAAVGFRAQSAAIEVAESAVETVDLAQAINRAVLATGDERLLRLGGGAAPADEITAATDTALTDLEAQVSGTTSAPAVAAAAEAIAASRQSATGSVELLSEASALLLRLETSVDADYPTAEARSSAILNRLMAEGLEAREVAWIAYLEADSASAGELATVARGFARSEAIWDLAGSLAGSADERLFTSGLLTGAARELADLETVAVDDLAEGQLTISESAVTAALTDFRAEWAPATAEHGRFVEALIVEQLEGENNLRSLFSLLAALGLVVLTGLIFVTYRSITLPLQTLLQRASDVADHDLPALVHTLRHTEATGDLPSAQPIPVDSHDEIGELVMAFNDVQATAYELATEQAVGRRVVAELYVNLGRRNQQLLQRILAHLTQLERDEEDPETLAALFELDNIVTRMRRNAESLLALAGAATARQWAQPVSMENTIRAAFGEVENYHRITVGNLSDVNVRGSVVADITHLLAELLENGLKFSEPDTPVVIDGYVHEDGYLITVVDSGIGMTQRELVDHNQRIADPPPLDQVPTKFLGLYVVGRLAERHGITAVLGEGYGRGVMARIELPPSVLASYPTGADDPVAPAGSGAQAELAPAGGAHDASPLEERHDLDAELASLTLPAGTSPPAAEPAPDAPTDSETAAAAPPDGAAPSSSPPPTGVAGPTSEPAAPAAITPAADPEQEERGASAAAGEEEEEEEEAAAEPLVAEGGLPVRSRGAALQTGPQPATTTDAPTEQAAAEASGSTADQFSNMMSALSTGISRGMQDSERDGEQDD